MRTLKLVFPLPRSFLSSPTFANGSALPRWSLRPHPLLFTPLHLDLHGPWARLRLHHVSLTSSHPSKTMASRGIWEGFPDAPPRWEHAHPSVPIASRSGLCNSLCHIVFVGLSVFPDGEQGSAVWSVARLVVGTH